MNKERDFIDLGVLREKINKIKQQAQEEDWLLPHHQQLILNELNRLNHIPTSSHFPPKNQVAERRQ